MPTHRLRTQAEVDHFYAQRSGYFLNHYRNPRRNRLMCLHEAGCMYYDANPPSIGYTKTHCDDAADVLRDLGEEGTGWYSCPGCNPHLSIRRGEAQSAPRARLHPVASGDHPKLSQSERSDGGARNYVVKRVTPE